MSAAVRVILLNCAYGIASGVLASLLTVWIATKRKRIIGTVFVTTALIVGLVLSTINNPEAASTDATEAGSGEPSKASSQPGVAVRIDPRLGPDRPLVSVADLVAAAKIDPDRPQGEGTPGRTQSVERFENALAVAALLNRRYVDGSYGSATLDAVKRFQASIGDVPDGVPGILELRSIASRSGTFTAVP